MESVGQLYLTWIVRVNLTIGICSYADLGEPEVAAFIKDSLYLEQKFDGVFQKFNQYISERNRFLLGDPDYVPRL